MRYASVQILCTVFLVMFLTYTTFYFSTVFDLEATYSAAVLYLYIQLQNFSCSLHSNSSWAAGQPLETPFTQAFWGQKLKSLQQTEPTFCNQVSWIFTVKQKAIADYKDELQKQLLFNSSVRHITCPLYLQFILTHIKRTENQ